MAGTSQASNLTGMLSGISDTIGQMGEPGRQYVDTFRRSMAPELDLESSESLLNYSNWAKRNGYDEEAEKYLALGYTQKAKEGEKAYKTRIASDSEKLRGFNASIGELESQLSLAYEEGNPKASYIENALDRVKDAQRQHISAMNDYGSANDYGTGNEGGVAQRAYKAEILAAEKAALERQELVTKIQTERLELEDSVSKALPIDAASLPPAVREEYARLSALAQESPVGPGAAMRQLNATYLPIAQQYLEDLAKGDKATTALLWGAVSNVRNSDAYSDDVKDYINDYPDHVSKAIERAEASLTGNTEYRKASPAKKQQMAEEALMMILRGQQADFDEIVVDEYEDLDADRKTNEARSGYKDRDRRMQYKPGMEQGGIEYNKYLAKAKETLGEEFDQAEFDRNWDRRYFSPGGAISPTSATGSVLRKGPY